MGAGWAWARRGAVIWTSAPLQVPVFAVLWVAGEEARSVAPFGGFPWARLAFSQADSPLRSWAWAGGVPLVSMLVAGVGVLLALAVIAVRTADIAQVSGLVLVAVVVATSALSLIHI